MKDMKPCPFCGHPRSRLMNKREYCKDVDNNIAIRFAFWRKCNKCGATSSIVKTRPVHWLGCCPEAEWTEPWREQANEAWNRRAGECDRNALLELTEEMDDLVDSWGGKYPTNRVAAYARVIRKAIGEE